MDPQAHAVLMFLLQCSGCGRRELVGSRAIVALVNPPGGGVDVHLRCPSCGQVTVELTGRRCIALEPSPRPRRAARVGRSARFRRAGRAA